MKLAEKILKRTSEKKSVDEGKKASAESSNGVEVIVSESGDGGMEVKINGRFRTGDDPKKVVKAFVGLIDKLDID